LTIALMMCIFAAKFTRRNNIHLKYTNMNDNNNLSKKSSTTSRQKWSEDWDNRMENLLKSQDKTYRESKEITQQIKEVRKSIKETDQIVKNLGKQIGGVSNSNGDVAEAYFINSFRHLPRFAGQDFQIMEDNVSKYSKILNLRGEYDLLLFNGTSVAIIEIKYKAKKEDVEQVINKVETFKALFPQYKNYAIYLGLAGLSIEKIAEKEAIKQGVGIIKQVGKNVVINDAHLKVF